MAGPQQPLSWPSSAEGQGGEEGDSSDTSWTLSPEALPRALPHSRVFNPVKIAWAGKEHVVESPFHAS